MMRSDDSAYLWVKNFEPNEVVPDFSTATIKNPGKHGDGDMMYSNPIQMNAGQFYRFIVLYGQNAGGANLSLQWTGPNTSWTTKFEGVWFYAPP